MTAKASTNRSFPIPNEGGSFPLEGGVFKSVVIRSPSASGQTPESIHPLVAKLCGRKAPCWKGRGKMGSSDGKENRTLRKIGKQYAVTRDLSRRVLCHHKLPRAGVRVR